MERIVKYFMFLILLSCSSKKTLKVVIDGNVSGITGDTTRIWIENKRIDIGVLKNVRLDEELNSIAEIELNKGVYIDSILTFRRSYFDGCKIYAQLNESSKMFDSYLLKDVTNYDSIENKNRRFQNEIFNEVFEPLLDSL